MNNSKRNQAKREIQEILHYHGCEEFLKLTYEAMQDAADDTQDFEDKTIRARYIARAMQLDNLIDDAPDSDTLKSITEDID